MPDSYVVRRSPGGIDRTEEFLDGPFVAIGWRDLGDMNGLSKEQIRQKYRDQYPDASNRAIGIRTGYMNRFVNKMEEGNTVLVPRKGEVYVGEITGPYDFKESVSGDYAHQRSVKWKFMKSPIDGHKAPHEVYKKLYPGGKGHTVQDIPNEDAVRTFIQQSAGAEKMQYYQRLQAGTLYGINKRTIEDAVLILFQKYYPTMINAGTNSDEEGDTDLIAEGLPGETTVRVQIKHYTSDSKPIDNDVIDQLTKSMSEDDIGIVVTLGEIDESTIEYASKSDFDLTLIDGKKYTELLFDNRSEFTADEREVLGIDTLPRIG